MRQSRKEVNKQRRVRTLCKIFNLSGLTSQLVFVLMRSNNDYEETRELPYFGTRSCFSLGCGGRGNLVHLCSLDPVSTVVGLPRFLKIWRLAITVFKSSEKLHTSWPPSGIMLRLLCYCVSSFPGSEICSAVVIDLWHLSPWEFLRSRES